MKKTIFMFALLILVTSASALEIKEFSLPILNQDDKFTLSEHLGSKTIVINFFASWCTACVEETPDLHSLQNMYNTNDYIFIAINSGESRGVINKFIKKYKFKYIILEDTNKSVASLYNITSLPKTIVISKSKRIVFFGNRPPKKL